MNLVSNSGQDRVIDLIKPHLKTGNQLNCVTPTFSLHAFAELRDLLKSLGNVQLILPHDDISLELLGGEGDRAARNRLQTRWLANQCAKWVKEKVDLRCAANGIPQAAIVLRNPDQQPEQVILGSFGFSTDGLGLTPGNPLNLIQASESADEAAQLARWFDHQWSALRTHS